MLKKQNSFKKRGLSTRRSKLEMFADILRVLANRGPLKTIHIMQKTNVNSKTFREYAEFLVKQGLVEERSSNGGRIAYEITPRGVLVFKASKNWKKYFSHRTQH